MNDDGITRGLLTMTMTMAMASTWAGNMSGLSGGNTRLLSPLMIVIAAVELIALVYVPRHAARRPGFLSSTGRQLGHETLSPATLTAAVGTAVGMCGGSARLGEPVRCRSGVPGSLVGGIRADP